MSERSKRILLQVLTMLMVTAVIGLAGSEVARKLGAAGTYSVIEDTKSDKQVKVVLPPDNIKPSVGNAVQSENPDEIPVLTLHADNTLVFNDVVTDESVAQFLVKANDMSNKIPANQPIYIVMYTPGGSVDAGMQLIDAMKALPQKVKTLTLFSASMGFQIVQNMEERLITPSGVLMSHRANGGLEGEFGGELDVRLNMIRRQLQYMDQKAADRMKMTLEDYRKLIADEYWIHGFEAVGDRAADKMILARCGKEMTGTEDKIISTFFGDLKVKFSKCPLITGPLEIELADVAPANRTMALEAVKLQFENPREHLRTYIKTGKFKSIYK